MVPRPMPDPAPRRFARLSALAAVVALGAAGWYFLVPDGDRGRPAEPTADLDPPPDPRLTFDSPFRNVRPDVTYVGDVACAGCHAEIDKAYHAHPMGRSADFVAKA